MDAGQIVDYIIEFNEMHKQADSPGKARRKATQADIDRFFGA